VNERNAEDFGHFWCFSLGYFGFSVFIIRKIVFGVLTFGILAFGTLDFGFLDFGFIDFGILDFGILDSVFWAVTLWDCSKQFENFSNNPSIVYPTKYPNNAIDF